MSDQEIAALPLADLAHPSGCNFFVWTISPLNERFWTRVWPAWKAQGLRYSGRAFVWIKLTPNGEKLHVGQGQTTRKNAEDVLLFKTGRPKRLVKNVHEIIVTKRGKHSEKPDEFYSRVERYCDGPRADVFARRRRPGWDAFGWGVEE
jgi:N6-adenosine-specific RNA methylase IME4